MLDPRHFIPACTGVLALSLCGCQLLVPTPPGRVLQRSEAEFDTTYKLYEPTHHDAERASAVVVLCGQRTWPGGDVLMSDWASVAEEQGLLLVAPELSAIGNKARPIDLQRDEDRILAVLNHLRGRCQIREDRILIVGYGKAARPAAYVGLRHPEVFRVVGLMQPHFDAEDLQATESRLDAHQPALVVIKLGDFSKDQSYNVARWIQQRQITVSEVKTSGARHTFVEVVDQFWQRMLRQQPWVRVEAFHTNSARTVRFEVQSSFDDVKRYEWDFGDGTTDLVARPRHTYASPGTYDVSLKIYPNRREYHERRLQITIAN